jgi:hypothetical protein
MTGLSGKPLGRALAGAHCPRLFSLQHGMPICFRMHKSLAEPLLNWEDSHVYRLGQRSPGGLDRLQLTGGRGRSTHLTTFSCMPIHRPGNRGYDTLWKHSDAECRAERAPCSSGMLPGARVVASRSQGLGYERQMRTRAQSSPLATMRCMVVTSSCAPVLKPVTTRRSASPRSRWMPSSMSRPGASTTPSV